MRRGIGIIEELHVQETMHRDKDKIEEREERRYFMARLIRESGKWYNKINND